MREFEDIGRLITRDAEKTFDSDSYSPKIKRDRTLFMEWENGRQSTKYTLKKFLRGHGKKNVKINEDYFVRYLTEFLHYENHHFDTCEQFEILDRDLENFDKWSHGEIDTDECIRRFVYDKRGKKPNKFVFEEWLEKKGY